MPLKYNVVISREEDPYRPLVSYLINAVKIILIRSIQTYNYCHTPTWDKNWTHSLNWGPHPHNNSFYRKAMATPSKSEFRWKPHLWKTMVDIQNSYRMRSHNINILQLGYLLYFFWDSFCRRWSRLYRWSYPSIPVTTPSWAFWRFFMFIWNIDSSMLVQLVQFIDRHVTSGNVFVLRCEQISLQLLAVGVFLKRVYGNKC